MSVNFNDVAKQGYVKVKSKLGLWNQAWLILRRPSSKGPLRLDKYPDEKASMLMESAAKAIELKDIHEIYRNPRDEKKHGIVLLFENGKMFQMALQSESEAEAWLVVLKEFCRMATQREGPPGMDLLSNSNMQDVFNVCLIQTPALNVYGECLLQITADSIYLLDVEQSTRRIMVWPLNCLRRYSRDETKFTFESGRSCKTGEGLFIFNTIHGEEIYNKVWSASKAIAEAYKLTGGLRRNPSDPTSPVDGTAPQLQNRRPLPTVPGVPLPPTRRF